MTLINFCETPRTMVEIEAEGFSRHQVYGAVKRGAGLFTVACPAPKYDAAPLVAAWR